MLEIVVDMKVSSVDKNMSLNDGALLIDDASGSRRVSARFSHRSSNDAAVTVDENQQEDYSYTDNALQAWNFVVYSRYALEIPTEVTVSDAKEILVEIMRIFRPWHLPLSDADQQSVVTLFNNRIPYQGISSDAMTINVERLQFWFVNQAKILRNKVANGRGISGTGGMTLPAALVI
jgi:hypothetical protein